MMLLTGEDQPLWPYLLWACLLWAEQTRIGRQGSPWRGDYPCQPLSSGIGASGRL